MDKIPEKGSNFKYNPKYSNIFKQYLSMQLMYPLSPTTVSILYGFPQLYKISDIKAYNQDIDDDWVLIDTSFKGDKEENKNVN